MDNYISQIINTKIDFLKSSFEANKTVNHQGIKGSLNETLFLELVRDIIPKKYKLTKGIIQDKTGYQSNESDIILYNNEILPALLFGLELGFVPCEAVEYTFEIKSTLNSRELDTTIKKFINLKKSVGYIGRNVLFAFSSDIKDKSELERYYEKDESFLYNPFIGVFAVMNKGYYFFDRKKIYIKDFINKKDFLESMDKKNLNFDVPLNIEELDLVINEVNYEDIYFNYYCWTGVEEPLDNCNILGLLSGISNTLCQKSFGNYLLSGCDENKWTRCSEYIVDMWNNESYKRIEFNGFSNSILDSFRFNLSLNEDKKRNKLTVYEGKK